MPPLRGCPCSGDNRFHSLPLFASSRSRIFAHILPFALSLTGPTSCWFPLRRLSDGAARGPDELFSADVLPAPVRAHQRQIVRPELPRGSQQVGLDRRRPAPAARERHAGPLVKP